MVGETKLFSVFHKLCSLAGMHTYYKASNVYSILNAKGQSVLHQVGSMRMQNLGSAAKNASVCCKI